MNPEPHTHPTGLPVFVLHGDLADEDQNLNAKMAANYGRRVFIVGLKSEVVQRVVALDKASGEDGNPLTCLEYVLKDALGLDQPDTPAEPCDDPACAIASMPGECPTHNPADPEPMDEPHLPDPRADPSEADKVRAAGLEPCCDSPFIREAQDGTVYHDFDPLTGKYDLCVDGDPETLGYACSHCGHGWSSKDAIFQPGHKSEAIEALNSDGEEE